MNTVFNLPVFQYMCGFVNSRILFSISVYILCTRNRLRFEDYGTCSCRLQQKLIQLGYTFTLLECQAVLIGSQLTTLREPTINQHSEGRRFHFHYGGSRKSLYLLIIYLYEIQKRRKAVVLDKLIFFSCMKCTVKGSDLL